MRSPTTLSAEEREEIHDMRLQKKSWSAIAKHFNMRDRALNKYMTYHSGDYEELYPSFNFLFDSPAEWRKMFSYSTLQSLIAHQKDGASK